jgi:hypothetical protein
MVTHNDQANTLGKPHDDFYTQVTFEDPYIHETKIARTGKIGLQLFALKYYIANSTSRRKMGHGKDLGYMLSSSSSFPRSTENYVGDVGSYAKISVVWVREFISWRREF